LKALLSSFAAFVAAGVRPQTPLAKAIVLMLVIKLLAITGIGIFMGQQGGRLFVDAVAVSRLIGPSLSLPDEEGR
jgi:hypothetical protein